MSRTGSHRGAQADRAVGRRIVRAALAVTLAAGSLVAFAVVAASVASAAQTYSVTDLGVIPDYVATQTPFGNLYSTDGVTSDGSVLFPLAGLMVNGALQLPPNVPAPVFGSLDGEMVMLGVNDSKVVVGYSGSETASIWPAGTSAGMSTIDFTSLVPDTSSINLSYANVVDDAGEIAGEVNALPADGGVIYFYMSSPTAAPVASVDPLNGASAMITALNYPWEIAESLNPSATFRYNRVTGERDVVPENSIAIMPNGTVLTPTSEILPSGATVTLAAPAGGSANATSISNTGIAVGEQLTSQGGTTVGVWDATGAFTAVPLGPAATLYHPVIGTTGLISAMGASATGTGNAYLLKPSALPPPVVNSTGDASAANNGASGCDTGAVVAVNGKNQPECTLRAAIQAENAGSVDDKTITFALPTQNGVVAIQPATPLPALTADGVTVDGTTAPNGFIDINGFNLPAGSSALHVSGATDTVQGLVAANAQIGVLIDSTAGGDTVRGCVLGITPGGGSTASIDEGIDIENSPDNQIGGTAAGDRNVLSGLSIGVLVHGAGSTGNRIQGNYLGTDVTGTQAIGDYEGVGIVDASNNVVGGSTKAAGNVMVGQSSQGQFSVSSFGAVSVGGFAVNATGNAIEGNTIGFLADGTTPATNDWGAGVAVTGRANGTIVGGSSAGAGNVIGADTTAGVMLSGSLTIGTQVLGNLIGTDRTGQTAAGRGNGIGVLIAGAVDSTIGNGSGGGNIITSNNAGIQVQPTPAPITAPIYQNQPYPGDSAPTTGPLSTLIVSNTIGPFADGKTGPADASLVQSVGVALGGQGDTLGPNNLISYNKTGVAIATLGETVVGNDIGTDSTGTSALPNGNGVLIGAANLSGFTIGSPGAKPNTVSGNLDNLVTASPTTVQNTYIGTTTLGNAALAPYAGTVPSSIQDATLFDGGAGFGLIALNAGTVIGGTQPGDGNVVSGNAKDGIVTVGAAVIEGNKIGVGADGTTPVPNGGNGVDVYAPAQIGGDPTAGAPTAGAWSAGLPAGGNVIANNKGEGILVNSATSDLLSNSVYANIGGATVRQSGPVAGPQFSSAPTQDGNGNTNVFIAAPAATTGTVVQVYLADSCTATGAQGKTLLQTDTINSPGEVFAAIPVQPVGTQLTATITSSTNGVYSTSDFSSCATVTAASSSLTSSSVAPGQPDSATANGFAPGEQVDATLHSTPVALGAVTAGNDGSVTVQFTVPADTVPGAHEVVLTGLTSGIVVTIPLTISGSASTAPVVTSGPPTSPATVGAAYDFAFTATGNPGPSFTVGSGALPGGLQLTSAGDLTGSPTAAGSFTFTVTVSNSAGTVAAGPFTIVVNQAPTFTSGAPKATATVGSGYSFGFSADGAPKPTFSVGTGALPTGLMLSAGGTLSGTPSTAGTFRFTVTATNLVSTATAGPFTITVAPATTPPVGPTAEPQAVTTFESASVAITLAGKTVAGKSLSYQVAIQPVHGRLSGRAPHLTYQPAAGYVGTDSFTFTVTAGGVTSAAATVSITVERRDRAPVARDSSVTTAQGAAVAAPLHASDPDGDVLTYRIVTHPAHGTLSGTAPNLTYTPNPGYHGSDSFTFVANDGHLTSNVAQIRVSVTAAAACSRTPPRRDVLVSTDQQWSASSISTVRFTTRSADELLVAFVSADGPSRLSQQATRVTGGGLAWTLAARAHGVGSGDVEVWQAYATSIVRNGVVSAILVAPGPVTLTVASFTGAVNRLAVTAAASGDSAMPNATITPQQCGALVWGVARDWSRDVCAVAAPGQTIAEETTDRIVGPTPFAAQSSWIQTLTTPSIAGQAVTLSDSLGAKGRWRYLAIEIDSSTR